MNNKKTRAILLNLNIAKNTKVKLGDKYTLEVGGLPPSHSKNSVDIVRFVDRSRENKKNKITSLYASENKSIAITPVDLLYEYDAIFVVDTNTKELEDEKLCVGAVGNIVVSGSQIGLMKTMHVAFKVAKEDNNFEKYTWIELIKMIQESKSYSEELKIGIVVDSYLGDIPKYNSHKKAILEDFMLPENFVLMYAGSDKKGDGLLNWAIHQCDKAANNLKEQYLDMYVND